jgi:heme/copper-type cytochrome/quinol oxidase subunit 2
MGLLALLAHAGDVEVSESGVTAMTVMLVAVLTTVWVALGVVCWIFWRAKKREDAKKREIEWRNARLS